MPRQTLRHSLGLLPLLLSAALPEAVAAERLVSDVEGLREAVAAAAPGDTVRLSPGTYLLESSLLLDAVGTAEAPITLDGDGATLQSNTVEAIKVRAPYWHITDTRMEGVCAEDSDCEHALHIVGAAEGTEVRGCSLIDFNAQIKGNGEEIDGAYAWPDDVVIEGNDLHDTRPRMTSNPVTKIDVVGGQRWRVVANRIADFEKGEGDTVSYAAFFKGNSKDGLFERNLVLCADTFSGGVRVGLSLGGGGTSPDSICEDGTCSPEHQRGRIQNNIIAGCNDVGVYLNEAADSAVTANILFDTSGVDVRYPASTVSIEGNVLDGAIRERDGGTAALGMNWAGVDLVDVYVAPEALDFTLLHDPGLKDALSPIAGLDLDFCGAPRDAAPDGGALEYTTDTPCDTTVVHPSESGEGDADTDADSDADTDADSDADADADSGDGGADGKGGAKGGCGCASAPPVGAGLLSFGLSLTLSFTVALGRRRPRASLTPRRGPGSRAR